MAKPSHAFLLAAFLGLGCADAAGPVREEWSEKGMYAYFEFVEGGVENRRRIADALERQGCRVGSTDVD